MNTLLVTNTYPPGDISGVGTLAIELARRLAADGHRVRVLTRRAAAGDPYAIVTGGPKALFPLLAAWRYLRLPGAASLDVVHVHESDGVLVALMLRAARVLRLPRGRARLLATLQVSYVEERRAVRAVCAGGRVVSRPTWSERRFAWLRAPLLAALGRLTARLADAVIAPSTQTAAELRQQYRAKIAAVIPNGVTPLPAAARRPRPEPPVFLYCGRLRTRKAVAVLLEAFARARGELGRGTLVLVGDGEQRRALEAQAARLGLGAAVRFTGALPREEVGGWLAAADVFCLPSLYEGMPLAILEAMAAGLPVIATAVSGNPEALGPEAGVLVPPEDDVALAAALRTLGEDAALRRRLGAAARSRARERFGIERIVAEHQALLERLTTATLPPAGNVES